jgi:uncharacterized membrane protein
MRALGLTWLDAGALIWFYAWWVGYARFAELHGKRVRSLLSAMAQYRRDWWVRMIERELRMIDTSIIANLSNSSTFFASTTLLILGGLLALLGTTDKVSAVVQGLPFNKQTTEAAWEVKILLLVGIFVYAFFKFTWSMRLFNVASVLVGAAPRVPRHAEEVANYIDRGSRVSHFAAEHFNYGLRAYYFSLAALAWFLDVWFFMGATAWVVLILYWREFRSAALQSIEADDKRPLEDANASAPAAVKRIEAAAAHPGHDPD